MNAHQTREDVAMIVTRSRMFVLVGRPSTVVLHRPAEAVKQWRQFLMAAERRVEADIPAGDSVPVVR